MNRPFLFASLVFGGSLLATLWWLPGRGASRGIRVSGSQIDFGELGGTEDAEKTISVANLSEEAFDLRISSDCSCLSVEPLLAHVPAGSSTEIPVRPNGPAAAVRSGSWLEIDQPIEIIARGNALNYRKSIPVSASYFSPLRVDPNTLQQSLDIWSPEVWAISFSAVDGHRPTAVRADATFIERAELDWNEDVGAGLIEIVPKTPLEVGAAEGTVTVTVDDPTDDLPARDVDYRVEVTGALPYEITPSVIDFSARGAASPSEREAVVEVVSDSTIVDIAAPESGDPRLLAQVDPDNASRLSLRLLPPGSGDTGDPALHQTRVRFNVVAVGPEGDPVVFPDSALVVW